MEESVAARRGALVVGLLLGAGVSVALGVYGRVHVPSYEALPSFGFSSTATFKAWLGSVVVVLAASQAVTALWMYGRLPGVSAAPRALGRVHRATGFVAFVLSLPVAAYCLYGLGFAPAPYLDAHPGPFGRWVRVLRRLRRQGSLRPHPGSDEVGASGDRSAAAHHGGGGVADQRPLALLGRRSNPLTGSRGFTCRSAPADGSVWALSFEQRCQLGADGLDVADDEVFGHARK